MDGYVVITYCYPECFEQALVCGFLEAKKAVQIAP